MKQAAKGDLNSLCHPSTRARTLGLSGPLYPFQSPAASVQRETMNDRAAPIPPTREEPTPSPNPRWSVTLPLGLSGTRLSIFKSYLQNKKASVNDTSPHLPRQIFSGIRTFGFFIDHLICVSSLSAFIYPSSPTTYYLKCAPLS